MQTLTFIGPHHLEWREIVEPAIDRPEQALVRPIAVATCDLDTGAIWGEAPLPGPFELGHEFVAEVLAVGDAVTATRPGDLVIVPFQISCGTCARCASGHTGSCLTVPPRSAFGLAPLSREWGGALADLALVPFADAMVVPLPAGVDPVVAASVSDNVPDGWRAVAGPLERRPGAPVLVVGGAGAGSVGLYATAVAVALGAERVDYVDDDETRLRVAEKVGANPIEGARERRYGPYPIVVNHAADADGLHAAIRSVEPGGVVTSTSIYFEELTGVPLLEMYGTGVTLTTGRVNARASIPAVLDLVTSGRLRPELVTADVVDWADAAEALAEHRYKTVVTRAAAS
jgi:threonine dehydrogenase-like Zn-dependent dehydrogenase